MHRIDLQFGCNQVRSYDFPHCRQQLRTPWQMLGVFSASLEEHMNSEITIQFLMLETLSTTNFFSTPKMRIAPPWCFRWLSSNGLLSLSFTLDFAVRMLRRRLENDFIPRSFLPALEIVILVTFRFLSKRLLPLFVRFAAMDRLKVPRNMLVHHL